MSRQEHEAKCGERNKMWADFESLVEKASGMVVLQKRIQEVEEEIARLEELKRQRARRA